jgi:hypothetical protein
LRKNSPELCRGQETHLAATLKEKEHLQTQGNAMQEKIAAQTNDLVLFDRKVQAMTMDLNNLQAQLQASGTGLSFSSSHHSLRPLAHTSHCFPNDRR